MIHISQAALEQVTKIFDRRKAAVGLSGYTVGALLDQGSMSNVYRIVDQSGNTDYVLRVSEEHKSSYSNDIFNVREMEILRELKKSSQPHVVQYLDAFAIDIPGQPRYYCAVMKFLRTLKQYRVDGDGVEIAVRLGVDFLPLLQSFMEKEIIHRDIKPENIFYDCDFRNDTGFLLGDFGIAKHDTNTTVTATGKREFGGEALATFTVKNVLGDADGNGEVNIADATLMQRVIAGYDDDFNLVMGPCAGASVFAFGTGAEGAPVTGDDGKVSVTVGSVEHPMLDEKGNQVWYYGNHYIGADSVKDFYKNVAPFLKELVDAFEE